MDHSFEDKSIVTDPTNKFSAYNRTVLIFKLNDWLKI